MRNRKISYEKLKLMRNYLPQGSNIIISDITGFTLAYISKVLHVAHQNVQVIEEATKIALEERTRIGSLNANLDTF
jgi:hypothetical protein